MGNIFINKTNDEVSEKQKLDAEKRLIKKIEEGLRLQEFKMYLQFIVDGKTKKIISAEALSRWQTSDGEFVMPSEYIGIMEKSGRISKLDYYMFEKACKKLCEWNGTEFGDFKISCNFTRLTISETDFVSVIKETAEKYSFDRSKLIIEITEDCAEKNHARALENIGKAKELGFSIALDDIGSGCTSLINLCEYPVDVVKIDRDVLLMANTEKGKKLFAGIVNLSHNLEFEVVCEGVETEEQNTFVTESNCDYIQGWYYFKGLPENLAEESAREYMKAI